MTRSHNIVGCEATDPDRRLIQFSLAHGSIVELPRAGRRRALSVLTFAAAGAVLALLASAILLSRP